MIVTRGINFKFGSVVMILVTILVGLDQKALGTYFSYFVKKRRKKIVHQFWQGGKSLTFSIALICFKGWGKFVERNKYIFLCNPYVQSQIIFIVKSYSLNIWYLKLFCWKFTENYSIRQFCFFTENLLFRYTRKDALYLIFNDKGSC